MAYGKYSSYGSVIRSVETGACEVAVNHFRPYQLSAAVSARRIAARALYFQKCLIPMGCCVLLGLFAFSLAALPVVVCAAAIGAISYLSDIKRNFVLIGLISVAVGLTLSNMLAVLVGISFVLAFACASLWWVGITRLATDEVLADKERFDLFWNSALIVLVDDGVVWSVDGKTQMRSMTENVEAYASAYRKQKGKS